MIEYQDSLAGITPGKLTGFFVGWKSSLSPCEHFRILENSEFIVLAVDNDTQQVVGFVNALSDHVNFAFIPMIEVLPAYKGRGIGTRLMNRMLDQLHAIRCVDLTCDPELQSFYQGFGMHKSHGMMIRKYGC